MDVYSHDDEMMSYTIWLITFLHHFHLPCLSFYMRGEVIILIHNSGRLGEEVYRMSEKEKKKGFHSFSGFQSQNTHYTWGGMIVYTFLCLGVD